MPRYDDSHKAQTRARIIDAAGRRLKISGIDGSGVSALMSDAGLTNGAFYAHFESKDELVAAAVADQLARQTSAVSALPPGIDSLKQFVAQYLSSDHRDDVAGGCPSAALLDEIDRSSGDVRGAYTAGVTAMVREVAGRLNDSDPDRGRSRAIALLTSLVGTLQLARAVTDPTLAQEILDAGIVTATRILDK